MSKLNLIAIVAIVAAFAVSAVVATEVFAQSNSTSSSSPAGGNASRSNITSGSMPGRNMTHIEFCKCQSKLWCRLNKWFLIMVK
jgi:hypothetical protein